MSSMELITVGDAAKFLKVHPDTVRRHITHIPHVRIGNQIRISKQGLIDWVQDRMGSAEEE